MSTQPLIVRIRWRQLGAHVHCRVFTATSLVGTWAKSGDLVFTVDEWPYFVELMQGTSHPPGTPRSVLVDSMNYPVAVQIKHEDEL